MEPSRTPALRPAVALLVGTSLAPYLRAPAAAWLALAALGVASRRRLGVLLALAALGSLSGTLRWQGAAERLRFFDPQRPVEVVVQVASHPLLREGRYTFAARALTVRQGARQERGELEVWASIAADAEAPALGSRLRLRGYLRRAPGYANRAAIERGPWRLPVPSPRFVEVVAPPPPWMAAAAVLRRRAEGLLARQGTSDAAGLLRALLLGDRSAVPEGWQRGLRRAGLAHLLAVSGLHVGLVGLALLGCGSVLPRPLRLAAAALGVVLYLLLVGPLPSMVRATGMALLAGAALLVERPPQPLNALACWVAAVALLDPATTADAGFRLSAAATAGILLWAPRLKERWSRLPALLRRPLALTAAAQLATLPLAVELIGGISPAAPLLNLLAVPWLALTLAAAFLWLACAALHPILGGLVWPLLGALAAPCRWAAALPAGGWLFMPWPAGTAWAAAAAALLTATLLGARRWRLGALAASLVLLRCVPAPPGGPELVVFDVGQGDAILLRDGAHAVLVDGGGWRHGDLGGRVVVPALAAEGVRRLDAVLLTHPDSDHCGGLVDLLSYLPVDEVWASPGWGSAPCARRLLLAPGPRWRPVWRGHRLAVGSWRLEVLHPGPGERWDGNDRSVVVRAEAAGVAVLLTGDAGEAVERRLLRRFGGELAATVLKVAHHGSRTSTSAAWLDAVRPRLAVVSAGAGNVYGHPSGEVLGRLAGRGVPVLRTDLSGAVRLRCAGGRLRIELPGAPPARDAGTLR